MHINALADWLRAKLPWPIWNFFRKIANSVLGPLHFSLETGHLRSCLKSRAVDRKGEPLPWFVYPAIQFLLPKDFSQKLILEGGAANQRSSGLSVPAESSPSRPIESGTQF